MTEKTYQISSKVVITEKIYYISGEVVDSKSHAGIRAFASRHGTRI